VKALLAGHIVEDKIVSFRSAHSFLKVAGESFPVRGQCTETGHAELVQESVGEVDGGVKPPHTKIGILKLEVTVSEAVFWIRIWIRVCIHLPPRSSFLKNKLLPVKKKKSGI
jgi:hypothetical protein